MQHQRSLGIMVCLSLLLGTVSGCSKPAAPISRLNQQSFEAICEGMTPTELVNLLGEPERKGALQPSGSRVWLWEDGPRWISVQVSREGSVEMLRGQVLKKSENLE